MGYFDRLPPALTLDELIAAEQDEPPEFADVDDDPADPDDD